MGNSIGRSLHRQAVMHVSSRLSRWLGLSICLLSLNFPSDAYADVLAVDRIAIGMDVVDAYTIMIGEGNIAFFSTGEDGATFSNYGDNTESGFNGRELNFSMVGKDHLFGGGALGYHFEFGFGRKKLEMQEFPVWRSGVGFGDPAYEVHDVGTEMDAKFAYLTPIFWVAPYMNETVNTKLKFGVGAGVSYMKQSGTIKTVSMVNSTGILDPGDISVLASMPARPYDDEAFGGSLGLYSEWILRSVFARLNVNWGLMQGAFGKHNFQEVSLVLGYQVDI